MEKETNAILFHTGVRAEMKKCNPLLYVWKKYAGKAFSEDGAEKMVLQKIMELMKKDNIDTKNLSFSTIDEAVTTFTAIKEMDCYQYHDGEDWEWWLSQFEKIASRNMLAEDEKLQWLKACLTGYAAQTYDSYFFLYFTYESMKIEINTSLKAHQQIQQSVETYESDSMHKEMCSHQ